MSHSQPKRAGPPESETGQVPAPDALLELLTADYTRAILAAIRTEPKPARVIAEECGASRPTVYRRLNSLEDAGLVASGMAYESDGHHRTVFEATLETLSLDLVDDGLSVTVTTRDAGRTAPLSPQRVSSD